MLRVIVKPCAPFFCQVLGCMDEGTICLLVHGNGVTIHSLFHRKLLGVTHMRYNRLLPLSVTVLETGDFIQPFVMTTQTWKSYY